MDELNVIVKDLTTPQLKAIKRILVSGIPITAEDLSTAAPSQLCHKSPPKGYPKDKSDYGDSECYRYPLNTKSRCVSAWRYVHQARNKEVLGSKFDKVESKIKGYAKEHYNLELETAEADTFNWEEIFNEYYDGETMGERCTEILLEDETIDIDIDMSEKLKELETKTAEMEVELSGLRTYKQLIEAEKALAEKKKARQDKATESGVTIDLEDPKWLEVSDELFDFMLSQLKQVKTVQAQNNPIIIPPILNPETPNNRAIIRQGLAELKTKK